MPGLTDQPWYDIDREDRISKWTKAAANKVDGVCSLIDIQIAQRKAREAKEAAKIVTINDKEEK